MYRVSQAECALHMIVVAPQEYVNIYSTCRVAGEVAFGFGFALNPEPCLDVL